jgi:hypothetical protein
LSMDSLHWKAVAGYAVGKGRWNSGRPFEKSACLWVESPVMKAIFAAFRQAYPARLKLASLRNQHHLFLFERVNIFQNCRILGFRKKFLALQKISINFLISLNFKLLSKTKGNPTTCHTFLKKV